MSDPAYGLLGWPVVHDLPRPGDLVALDGHVGIYTGNGMTISASTDRGVVENAWGFRNKQKPVIRRCMCP